MAQIVYTRLAGKQVNFLFPRHRVEMVRGSKETPILGGVLSEPVQSTTGFAEESANVPSAQALKNCLLQTPASRQKKILRASYQRRRREILVGVAEKVSAFPTLGLILRQLQLLVRYG